jgi:uncharacterized HAD superfamily protein/NTP pyrophosphatase (non-canonical NTP hydrolase)
VIDRLQQIWDAQKKQQEDLSLDPDLLSPEEKRNMSGRMVLGMSEEVTALAKITARYKRHVVRVDEVTPENVSDKVADVMKYLVCLAQMHDVDADRLMESFNSKTAVVYDRARCERTKLKRGAKVICLDLDDVVCDLSPWTNRLAKLRGDAPMNERTLTMMESYKDECYRTGHFKTLKPIAGAASGIRTLKQMGYSIVIITARPQWQYPRLYADTLYWLKFNGIHHDLLLFNKDKTEAVFQYVRPAWPTFFVEDHLRNASGLASAGVDVLLFDQPANRGQEDTDQIRRVMTWKDVIEAVRKTEETINEGDCQDEQAAAMRSQG